jgi:hypothetical protein
MGSTGTGHFSDYSNNASKQGRSSGGGGGSSGEDRCNQAFSTTLEEVERCAYYTQNKDVPANCLDVTVRIQGRIGVETTNGVLIGYLPTQYNYLMNCIQEGRSYGGVITSTSSIPIVVVRVDIAPVRS